jgi:hypothetical protein
MVFIVFAFAGSRREPEVNIDSTQEFSLEVEQLPWQSTVLKG